VKRAVAQEGSIVKGSSDIERSPPIEGRALELPPPLDELATSLAVGVDERSETTVQQKRAASWQRQ
jgi:hypothetical protein